MHRSASRFAMPISAGLEKLHDLAAGALEKGDCHAQRAQIQILGLDRDLVSGRAHVLGGGSGVGYGQGKVSHGVVGALAPVCGGFRRRGEEFHMAAVAYVQQHDLAFGRTEFGKAECVKDFETTWCLNLVKYRRFFLPPFSAG